MLRAEYYLEQFLFKIDDQDHGLTCKHRASASYMLLAGIVLNRPTLLLQVHDKLVSDDTNLHGCIEKHWHTLCYVKISLAWQKPRFILWCSQCFHRLWIGLGSAWPDLDLINLGWPVVLGQADAIAQPDSSWPNLMFFFLFMV